MCCMFVKIINCSFCFLLNVIQWSYPSLAESFVITYSLASYFVFVGAFLAYLQFHHKYSTLTRAFSSPLGDKGAILGLMIFLFGMITCIGFQGKAAIFPCVLFTILIISLVIYFQVFMAKNQIFSEEERDELFKAYLINGMFPSTSPYNL